MKGELETLEARLREAGVGATRFIDVNDGEKKSTDHTKLPAEHINGNYGVYAGNGLVILDVDAYRDLEETPDLPSTFTVRTPHKGTHHYYQVDTTAPDILERVCGARNPTPEWGEVQAENKYVVGPGSQLDGCKKEWCDGCSEPDGGRYTITKDREIAEIPLEELTELIGEREKPEPEPSREFDGGTEEETVREALKHVDPDLPHDEWIKIGFAVCNALDGAPGWARIFREWSKGGSKWDKDAEREIEYISTNADPEGGVSAGTLFHYAEQGGWTPPWRKTATNGAGAAAATSDDGAETTDTQEDSDNAVSGIRAWLNAQDDRPRVGEKSQKATAEILKHEEIVKTEPEDDLWVYNPETGVWEKKGEERIIQILDRGLGGEYSRRIKNEVFDRVASRRTIASEDFKLPPGKIPVENGLLDLETLELENHRPEHYSRFKLPVEYDPEAEAPRWKQFLEEVTRSGNDRDKLQEYVGYVFMHHRMPHHKTLFLAGPEASGKSTFIDAVAELIPPEIRGGSTPQQLTRQFGRARLRNRWLNVSADIPSEMIDNLGTFKMLTGEDHVEAEIKNVQETIQFTPTTKHIFSANQLPDVYEADDAFWRRILIVPFPESIPREDRDTELLNKLTNELPGILNWAVKGYKRLKENDGFTADLVPEKTRERWESWGTSVVRFHARMLREDIGNTEPKNDVYSAYVDFCKENDMTPLSKSGRNGFGEKIKRYPHIGSKQESGGRTGGSTRVYTNIRLRDDVKESGYSENL